MDIQTFSGIVYLVLGIGLVSLFRLRRAQLRRLRPEDLDGLPDEAFAELLVLLKTAYDRTLYMGVLFFPLGGFTLAGPDPVSRLFFLALIFFLFLANIPPRHRAVRLLEAHRLGLDDLHRLGIRL